MPRHAIGSNQYATRGGVPVGPRAVVAAQARAVGGPTVRPTLVDDRGVRMIARIFAENGTPIYLVGGAIRDRLLGRDAKDMDLCCGLPPGRIRELLDPLGSVYDQGEQFGTIGVMIDGAGAYEVTSFRGESYTAGSRNPSVSFDADLEEDLARRDFTINAMAWDPMSGHVLDPLGGADDLRAGILRAPGDPDRRFSDDPLRCARLLRFVTTYDFEPETRTAAAARRCGEGLASVSLERRRTEVVRMLASDTPNAFHRMLRWSESLGTDRHLFGRLDVDAARHMFDGDPGTDARLAALCWVTRSADPGSELHSMTYTKTETRDAVRAASVADLIAGSGDLETSRRIVRSNSDHMISVARSVLAAAGKQDLMVPMSDTERARWRAPLPIDGSDLTRIGMSGPAVGASLRAVEAGFLRGTVTDRESALRAAQVDHPQA